MQFGVRFRVRLVVAVPLSPSLSPSPYPSRSENSITLERTEWCTEGRREEYYDSASVFVAPLLQFTLETTCTTRTITLDAGGAACS